MSEAPPAKRPRETPKKPVPITLLSGFLGTGKTTLLKHLLENKEGLKIGVIVNDIAEINIDKALISSKAAGGGGSVAEEDTVELHNGCACCTSADEFMLSVEKLISLSVQRGFTWDHIVVEATGVAEPREIRENFACVKSDPAPASTLHTLVTVVDSSTFLKEFEKRNKVQQRPDLGTDDYEKSHRQVVDLMCEQIEAADVLVLNKVDLVGEAELALLKETVASLNPLATVLQSEHGRLPLSAVLAAAKDGGVAELDEEAEHRRHVRHITAAKPAQVEHSHVEHSHVELSHAEHSHVESAADAHGHGHADNGAAACKVEGCALDNVQHDHSHKHVKPLGREHTRFGITSFCYQRRRPFHPHRLMNVIRQLPVKQEHLALSEALSREVKVAVDGEEGAPSSAVGATDGAVSVESVQPSSPMCALIRSKGFLWLSNSHSQIFYWALAGKHFELKQYAAWWQCLPREEWPQGEKDMSEILHDFQGEYGDHRQEIVFIGVQMDHAAISALLDECLLSDSEMEAYRKHWGTSTPPVENGGA